MPSLLVESPFVEPYFLLCLETTMLTEVSGSRTMISSTLRPVAKSGSFNHIRVISAPLADPKIFILISLSY
jgi:hypothetical protein